MLITEIDLTEQITTVVSQILNRYVFNRPENYYSVCSIFNVHPWTKHYWAIGNTKILSFITAMNLIAHATQKKTKNSSNSLLC